MYTFSDWPPRLHLDLCSPALLLDEKSFTYDSDVVRLYSQWAEQGVEALLILVGTLAEFIPPTSRQKERPDKWASSYVPWVFLGDEHGERGQWNSKYLAIVLKDFVTVNLSASVYASNLTLGEPNRLSTVRASIEDWSCFPFTGRVSTQEPDLGRSARQGC